MFLYANISKFTYIFPHLHLSYTKSSILYTLFSTLPLSFGNVPRHWSFLEHRPSSLSVNGVSAFHCARQLQPLPYWWRDTCWCLMSSYYTQSFNDNLVQMALHCTRRYMYHKGPPEQDCCPVTLLHSARFPSSRVVKIIVWCSKDMVISYMHVCGTSHQNFFPLLAGEC